MKERLEFESLRDAQQAMPAHKRPQDILVEGKSIFEQPKTPAQIEIIRTAISLVREHLKKLGVGNIPFDEKRIIFTKQPDLLISGIYKDGDYIVIAESSEANLATIIHEIVHAEAAEWRNYDEDELEKFLDKNSKAAKSGFHRNDTFKTINEGITEKITRDIVDNNITEFTRLKPLFKGRMEDAIAEENRRFMLEVFPARAKAIQEEERQLEVDIQKLKDEAAKHIAEVDQQISLTEDEGTKSMLLQIRKNNESSLEWSIQTITETKKFINKVRDVQKPHEAAIEDIKSDYSFSPENRGSYDFNVEVISLLIEGIAKYNIKANNTLNFIQERERVWKELQEAYFRGRTVYLRKIDKVFGVGFLRRIGSLSLLFLDNSEAESFLKETRDIINSI